MAEKSEQALFVMGRFVRFFAFCDEKRRKMSKIQKKENYYRFREKKSKIRKNTKKLYLQVTKG